MEGQSLPEFILASVILTALKSLPASEVVALPIEIYQKSVGFDDVPQFLKWSGLTADDDSFPVSVSHDRQLKNQRRQRNRWKLTDKASRSAIANRRDLSANHACRLCTAAFSH
ncbi:MAG TPA: hypothetical protein VNQ79_24900 [Blastocatellia bacterium]|nr:hypothetical protein [Blastocatellia bacterium]